MAFVKGLSNHLLYHQYNKMVGHFKTNRTYCMRNTLKFLQTQFFDARGMPKNNYGGRHLVSMLPGAGIGPEMMGHVIDVFSEISCPVDFEVIEIRNEDQLNNAIMSIQRNGVAIAGNIEPVIPMLHPNLLLRRTLDLYINIIHCKAVPSVKCRHPNLDIICVRQNTEGEYSMLEHENVKGVVESLKIITASNTERLARWTYEYAIQHKRKKVTILHKANIMKQADGLFLKTAKKVASEFPSLEVNDMIIDNYTNQAVSNSSQFDVLMMPNLYGVVASNILCGLIGGPGLMGGQNYGGYYAVFEPGTRNTGTLLAGKDIANPIAMLNASVLLLKHLKLDKCAKKIEDAITCTLQEGYRTADLGGTHKTSEIIKQIKSYLTGVC